MVAYNFQSQFVEAIRNGSKSHTIRRNGKRRHARPGESLQLYSGMRTKACKKIITDPECVAAIPISIEISTSSDCAAAISHAEDLLRIYNYAVFQRDFPFWLRYQLSLGGIKEQTPLLDFANET